MALAGRWLGGRLQRALPVVLLACTCVVMVLGADRGAQLVYGYGMGVQQAPPPAVGDDGHHDHGSHEH